MLQTCMLSNTPIKSGDPVVAFLLRGPSTTRPYTPHDFIEPISLPIPGTFTPENNTIFEAQNNHDFSRNFIAQNTANLSPTLDINDIIHSTHQKTYSFNYYKKYEGRLQYALIHAPLYRAFIRDLVNTLPSRGEVLTLINGYRDQHEYPSLILTMDPQPWPYSLSIYMSRHCSRDAKDSSAYTDLDALWESLVDLYTLCQRLKGLRRKWYAPNPYAGSTGEPHYALQSKLLQHAHTLVSEAHDNELDWLTPELRYNSPPNAEQTDNSSVKHQAQLG